MISAILPIPLIHDGHFVSYWQKYCKFPKYSDTQKICCNHSNIWTMWLYHRVMSPNDADGMANSVDPDQTALIWVCTVCPGLSVQKLWLITVCAFSTDSPPLFTSAWELTVVIWLKYCYFDVTSRLTIQHGRQFKNASDLMKPKVIWLATIKELNCQ